MAAIPAGSACEEDWLEPDLSQMSSKDGYGQSKVVAEQLVSDSVRGKKLSFFLIERKNLVCALLCHLTESTNVIAHKHTQP